MRTLKILVVDDEPLIAETIAEMLPRGHEIAVATTAREALARCVGTRFDVLITDYHMPEMSGIALAQAIDPERTCHTVLMTGEMDLGSIERSRVQSLYRKPISWNRLFQEIEEIARSQP